MKRANIAIILVVIILWTGLMSACKNGSGNGEFYSYNLSGYVKLGDYNKAEFKKETVSVTEKNVEERIKSELEKFSLTTSEIKEGEAQNGDTVNIDYTGYINDKAFDGGKDTGASLKLGSGQFIKGFEDGLVGSKAGDTVSLDLKFPDNYHKEFAGKKVRFEVKINAVYQTVYPELTDKLVRGISVYSSVKDYRDNIYKVLVDEETERVKTSNRNKLVEAVIKTCEIKKHPKNEVKKYKQNLIKQYQNTASEENLSFENFVSYNGYTMEQFEEKMQEVAEKLTEKEMVFLLIAKKEKIELTTEEYEKGLSEHMNKNKYTSRKSFLEAVGEDNFKGMLLVEKAIDTIESRLG